MDATTGIQALLPLLARLTCDSDYMLRKCRFKGCPGGGEGTGRVETISLGGLSIGEEFPGSVHHAATQTGSDLAGGSWWLVW